MNFQQYALIPEDNQAEFYLALAAAGNRKSYVGKHFSWVNTWPSRWPNAIFKANIPIKMLEQVIIAMMADINNDNLPYNWIAGAGSRPDILEEVLLMQGFELRRSDAAMVFDLNTTPMPESRPGEMEVIRLEDPALLQSWVELVIVNLLRGPLDSRDGFRELLTSVLAHRQFALWAGMLEGKIVATALTFLGKSAAGLFYVAVDSNYRKLGLGRQITHAAMKYAVDNGHKMIALHATDSSRIVYDKLGFREYGRLRYYTYPTKRK